MPDRIIVGDVEQAAEILRRFKWRGRDDWHAYQDELCSCGDARTEAALEEIWINNEDAVAVSQGLLDAERLATIEQQGIESIFPKQLARINELTSENERLRDERDVLKAEVVDRNIIFDPKNPKTDMSYYDAQRFHSLCAELWEIVEPDMLHTCAELVKSKISGLQNQLAALQAAVEEMAAKVACSRCGSPEIAREALAAYDQQPNTHPEENCPSSECPEHGTVEPSKHTLTDTDDCNVCNPAEENQ